MCGCEKHNDVTKPCTCICEEHANFERARELAIERQERIHKLKSQLDEYRGPSMITLDASMPGVVIFSGGSSGTVLWVSDDTPGAEASSLTRVQRAVMVARLRAAAIEIERSAPPEGLLITPEGRIDR